MPNINEPHFDELEVAESGRVFERYTAPVRGEGTVNYRKMA